MSRITVCAFTDCSSVCETLPEGPKELVSSKSFPERNGDLGQLYPVLMGIPMCKWAGWVRDLTQVCSGRKF